MNAINSFYKWQKCDPNLCEMANIMRYSPLLTIHTADICNSITCTLYSPLWTW